MIMDVDEMTSSPQSNPLHKKAAWRVAGVSGCWVGLPKCILLHDSVEVININI